MSKGPIILFISKGAKYLITEIDEFKRVAHELSRRRFKIEVVDISKNPEMAEKYKIEALPTLMIKNQRFVGRPSYQKIIEIFRSIEF